MCKIVKKFVGPNKIPYIITHDARTIRFANPAIKNGDTIKLSIQTGEILESYKQTIGNIALATNGNNKGRIGVITNIVAKPGKIDVVTLKDTNGSIYSTRLANIFIIGNGKIPSITLPRDLGVKTGIAARVNAAEVDSDDE